MKNRELTRDRVVSIVDGENLVGVYWKGTDGSKILFETTPEKADAIIRIFNGDTLPDDNERESD
jgi:hypothetical protein